MFNSTWLSVTKAGWNTLVSVYEPARVRVWDGCPSCSAYASTVCMCACVCPCQLSVSLFTMSSDLLPRACSFPSPYILLILTFLHVPFCLIKCFLAHGTLKNREADRFNGDVVYWWVQVNGWLVSFIKSLPVRKEIKLCQRVCLLNTEQPWTHSETLAGFCGVCMERDRQRDRGKTGSHSQLPLLCLSTPPTGLLWKRLPQRWSGHFISDLPINAVSSITQ